MGRIRHQLTHLRVAGVLVWSGLSLVVLWEYRRLGGQPRELNELWFLLSLLWAQFGCAAIYADWRHQGGRSLVPWLLFTILPPLILHWLVLGVLL